MEPGKDKFIKTILFTNKLVIKLLICLLTITLILASADLVSTLYDKIKEPPYFLIDVTTLFNGFSLVLIVAVGYELVKSLIIIISSESIPSFPIVQIAIIAVANKIITLDIKHTEPGILFGLAALITGLGLTYFFHRIPPRTGAGNKE